jgi:transposase-like protein
MECELDEHLLKETEAPNRRNGKMRKHLRSNYGKIKVETPRDRNGSFEPIILPKRQRYIGDGFEQKVISLYGLGLSYEDICEHVEKMYGTLISPSTITAITDKIIPDIKAWQSRPLESVYAIVYMDAIHYKVKENGMIASKAIYCLIGVKKEGIKDLLGIYLGENEGAKYWLNILNELKNRGVKDILIACIDNLKGFAEAIETVFPKTEVQLCVIHQIRNSFKYVSRNDLKDVTMMLKGIYKAATNKDAELALKELKEKYNKKYPSIIRSWTENWDRLMAYLKYPEEIRRIIYTTNIIEGFNRQLRKVTKTKGVFLSEMALLKQLYLIQLNVTSKWTQSIKNWKTIYSHLNIYFDNRLELICNSYLN